MLGSFTRSMPGRRLFLALVVESLSLLYALQRICRFARTSTISVRIFALENKGARDEIQLDASWCRIGDC
jgi:hypothetical protein